MNAPHPKWCLGGDQCTSDEHRGRSLVLDRDGEEHATITRVRRADGIDCAEVRVTAQIGPGERLAGRQLLALRIAFNNVLPLVFDRRTEADN